ncbi:MAG: small basic family protein [Chthonomonas sp.]|nr:small basic family protein [Chthonomonas sp.]
MILIPVFALILGLLIGLLPSQDLRGPAGVYLAVACLAGLDTVCGGIKSNFEGRFAADVFVSGFFTNCLLAFFLAWMGDQIGVDIFLVCALIFGQRIFNNLSLIRRHLLQSYNDWKKRRDVDASLST